MTEWHFSPVYDAEVSEQNDLFAPLDTTPDFDESRPPYKFQLLHGLYDKNGNCLSSDIGYLTMLVLDNWYTRKYGCSIYTAYIRHDWHLREIEKANREAYERGHQAALAGLREQEKQLQKMRRELRAEKRHWNQRKMQWKQAYKARQERLDAEAQSKNTSGYVYLIQGVNTPHFKIGKARQLKPRMDTFNVKLPMVIELICAIQTPDRHSLEGSLHSRFASKRVNGEWFALDAEDVAYIQSLARDT